MMDTTLTAPRTQTVRRPLTFRTLAVGALVGIALVYMFVQAVLLRQVEMPLPIFMGISLLLASLVAGWPVGGWRWTPLLSVAWSLVLLISSAQRVLTHLAQPESTLQFGAQLLLLGILVTGVVAGIGASVQNYRRPAAEQQLPRWVRRSYLVMAGLLVGAVAVAAIPQTGSGVQVDRAVLAQLPAVPLSAFNNGEIRVRAGQLTALRLENPDAAGHSFDVDALDLHVAMPAGSESLALFRANTPGTYTFYCAPHYNKATGQGMRGTLIVEP
jgi:plastocyanin